MFSGTPVANPQAGTPRSSVPTDSPTARSTTATAPTKIGTSTVSSPWSKSTRMEFLKRSIIAAPAEDAFFMDGMTPSKESISIAVDFSITANPNCEAHSMTGDSPVAPDSMPRSKVDTPVAAGLSSTATPTLESRSVSARSSSEISDSVLGAKIDMPVPERLTCAATQVLQSDQQPRESCRPSWARSTSVRPSASTSDGMPSARVGIPDLAGMQCTTIPVLESNAEVSASARSSCPATPIPESRCSSAGSSQFSRVEKVASARSRSTATPTPSHSESPTSSVTSFDSIPCSMAMPSSSGSSITGTPLLESLKIVTDSSVAPENAHNVPNASSEPAIFASQLVEKLIGSGIVGVRNGSSITRYVNSETGEGQTVVSDENGRSSTFSQETVSSVMTGSFRAARVLPSNPALARASIKQRTMTRDEKGCIKAIDGESLADFFDETVMRSWMGSLPKIHLMGFDQELRIRLSNLWTEYSKIKAEHEDYLENADYIFFGLDKNSTLKDLERAFRKLARKMHPDKNGGSDEAKARFQDLKERYEKLKRKMQCEKGRKEDQQKELLDEGQEFCDQSGSCDSDTEDANSSDMEQDLDRDALEKKIWEVVDAAKVMQRQMQAWKEQLDKAVPAQ